MRPGRSAVHRDAQNAALAVLLCACDCRRSSQSPGLARAQEERRSFGDRLLGGCGFVDAFRAQHPGVTGFTYWDHKTKARERNSGWRLDYCMARTRRCS